jgi:hypothetical protein
MSTLRTNAAQIGQSATATNNFTLYQPATPNGTVRLGVGNAGSVSADVVTVNSSGNVGIGTTTPTGRLHVATNTSAALINLTNSSTTFEAQVNGNDSYLTNYSPTGSLVLRTNGIDRIVISNSGSVNLQSGGQYTFAGAAARDMISIPHTGSYSDNVWLRSRGATHGHPYQERLAIVNSVGCGQGTGAGTGVAPNREYYVFDIPIGSDPNSVNTYLLDISSGSWNYGQRTTHAQFVITFIQSAASVTQVSFAGTGSLTVTAAVQNYGTGTGRHRIAMRNTGGLNGFKIALSTTRTSFSLTGEPSSFETNTNPI